MSQLSVFYCFHTKTNTFFSNNFLGGFCTIKREYKTSSRIVFHISQIIKCPKGQRKSSKGPQLAAGPHFGNPWSKLQAIGESSLSMGSGVVRRGGMEEAREWLDSVTLSLPKKLVSFAFGYQSVQQKGYMWDNRSAGEKECFIKRLHLAMKCQVDLKFWVTVSSFSRLNKVIKACCTPDT